MEAALRKVVIIFLLVFCMSPVFSQVLSQKKFIKAIQDADGIFYYDEDYEKAATLYEALLNIYPDNSNLFAKLGICYINIDGRSADALKLLIKASGKIVRYDQEYLEFGEKAPLDTYLYLAIAYHQNDSLKKAITLYIDAKKKLGNTKLFRDDYIDNQIKSCRYALEMQKNPLPVVTNLFAPWLGEFTDASNPVLAKNDSVFIFTQKKDGKTRILCSYKSDKWKRPVDITHQLGGYNELYSNSITGDGKLLIIYKLDGIDGNLYYSQRKDSTWSKIKSLSINTIYWESHGFITPDGKTLYFASNRPGGIGDLDIWISEKGDNDSWKRPVNCGNIINTPYNENTPFFDPESNTLYFSSLGQVSMGGYDVFRSTKKDRVWSNPTGLPFSLNSTRENLFYILNNNGNGFITSLYEEKTKSHNIYSIITGDAASKPIIASGTISLQDGRAVDPEQTHIQLNDQKTGTVEKIYLDNSYLSKYEVKPAILKVIISHIKNKSDSLNINNKPKIHTDNPPLTDTGSFKFEVKPGDYKLFVGHNGYKTDTINLNIPSKFSSNYIPVNSSLVPIKVFEGYFLSIKNIPFDFDSYKINEQAISNLEILRSVLVNYPDLKIEVAGYTDSKGTAEYNIGLADLRAQAVIDYFADKGISRLRFVKKAFGASGFVTINTNPDGSDNPDGRKYNRRAVFGIINPKTGVVIQQETYAPEHLRNPLSIKYLVILIKSKENLPAEYFRNLKMTEMHFVKTVLKDSALLYTIGDFYNKYDASVYLDYVKNNGFKDAYILSQFEIANSSNPPDSTIGKEVYFNEEVTYTIQLAASKKHENINQFNIIDGIREIVSTDGYFRYISGEFKSLSEAKSTLITLQQAGFKNAFIRELNSLVPN